MGKRKYEQDSGDSDFQSNYTSKRVGQASKKRTKPANEPPSSAVLHARTAHIINQTEINPIRTALLAWFSTVHDSRQMPWRKAFNPSLTPDEKAQRAYEVWISEIMLQQTQVATVIPYYNRWMEKFPTIHALANASIDEVNALWKGLGYYSRASRLLAGAKKAVGDFGGRLPNNAKDLQTHIPGIGRYSAGAISSIAYGENAPVLDGNVTRLLSRFLALNAPPKAKSTLDTLWSAAGAMVAGLSVIGPDAQFPGDVNQALIELGSTVCKVRDPNCDSCPLRPWCTAATNPTLAPAPAQLPDIEDLCTLCAPLPDGADASSFPMRAEKKKAREELDIVCLLEWRRGSDRRFLLVRRPQGGLLAGLSEFPTSANVSTKITPAKQNKIPAQLLADLVGGGGIQKIETMGEVVHIFSHIKKTYRVLWAVLDKTDDPPAPCGEGSPCWVPFDDVADKKLVGMLRCSSLLIAPNSIGTGVVKIWNLCKSRWDEEEE
ncbi:J domain-containing protein [Mycena kentingensis (nom. inval.)]|nr:J domain-containing protein [Mycena kentingensis (nom. inval.)]